MNPADSSKRSRNGQQCHSRKSVWILIWKGHYGHDILGTTNTKKCSEQHWNIFIVFIDLMKAFDSVSRQGLWIVFAKIGCSQKFINIIHSFHEGMMG